MISVDQVKSQANGRWMSIFSQLGIEVPENGSHGRCPIENDGIDRFRCDNKDGDGTFFCNVCGAGDGISLVRQCLELSFPDTLTKIAEVIGMTIEDTKQPKQEYDAKASLNRLWKASTKLTGSDPVSKYLHSRKIVLQPECVRYCPECWCSETKTKVPAMIAMFVGVDGKAISQHRTYLDGEKKADLKSPRKIMKGITQLAGGAIRLAKPKNGTLGIAEGIETAMSAMQISGIPCWSVVSTSLMKAFQPPEGIRRVIIFSDSDANFAGQQAAYTLANRLYSKDLLVEVEISPSGTDFNDVLKRG